MGRCTPVFIFWSAQLCFSQQKFPKSFSWCMVWWSIPTKYGYNFIFYYILAPQFLKAYWGSCDMRMCFCFICTLLLPYIVSSFYSSWPPTPYWVSNYFCLVYKYEKKLQYPTHFLFEDRNNYFVHYRRFFTFLQNIWRKQENLEVFLHLVEKETGQFSHSQSQSTYEIGDIGFFFYKFL